MADSEAPGDSRLEDPADDRVDTDPLPVVVPDVSEDDGSWDGAWHEPEPVYTDHRFDAFNAHTWTFKPAPPPWYRTKLAAPALIAVAVAVVALVVSVVLLAFSGPADEKEAPATEPSPTTTATTTTREVTATVPPPPPLPPPPPPESASQIQVPGGTVRQRPRQTKPPEIGVTRTPVTRSQISVSPQPRTPR